MLQYVLAFGMACVFLVILSLFMLNYKRLYMLDDNITYKVLVFRPSKHIALKMLYELNHKTLDLIKYMKAKYASRLMGRRENMKVNVPSDVVKAIYGEVQHVLTEAAEGVGIDELVSKSVPQITDVPEVDDCIECLNLILQNYNPDLLEENDPILTPGDKTFTLNFKRIAICLRMKNWRFYDMNTLMFVFLHEIAHTGTHPRFLTHNGRRDNHPPMFWRVFKFILSNAVEYGIIVPIEYNEKNYVTYCDIDIQNNPLFDNGIEPLV